MPEKRQPGSRTSTTRGVRGRPRVHQEPWAKVSVVLFERQVTNLDKVVSRIKQNSGKPMNRTEVIRALIDSLLNSQLDLADVESEATLRAQLTRRLR